MTEELIAIESSQTQDLVPQPPGVPIIGSKWVFSLKLKPDGNIDRYKACLVAQGIKQEYETNYDETFASVTKIPIVHVTPGTPRARQGSKAHI